MDLPDVSSLINEDWTRVVLLLVAFVVLIWAIITTVQVRRWKRKVGGSRMSRKMRRHWLVQHAKKRIHDAFQDDYLDGKISNAEYTALVRMMLKGMAMPSIEQQMKWNLIDVATPSKADTSPKHLKIIKEGIITRLGSWRMRQLLYKPMSIPGPLPGADMKFKVIKPKGVLLSKHKTA